MPDSKTQPQAPIEDMLAEIREILGREDQPGTTSPTGIPAETKPSVEGRARTLEDVVRDLLRPMLRRWFDENLQSLIDREMQAQAARAGSGAELSPEVQPSHANHREHDKADRHERHVFHDRVSRFRP